MSDYKQEIEEFRQFAVAKLNTHKNELQTQYENEKADRATLEKGYAAHRKILERELMERANDLLKGKEDQGLKTEMNKIISNITDQLSKSV